MLGTIPNGAGTGVVVLGLRSPSIPKTRSGVRIKLPVYLLLCQSAAISPKSTVKNFYVLTL